MTLCKTCLRWPIKREGALSLTVHQESCKDGLTVWYDCFTGSREQSTQLSKWEENSHFGAPIVEFLALSSRGESTCSAWEWQSHRQPSCSEGRTAKLIREALPAHRAPGAEFLVLRTSVVKSTDYYTSRYWNFKNVHLPQIFEHC